MAYTLEDFCTESHALLKSKPLASALTQMADKLSQLLANPDFVAQTFNDGHEARQARAASRSRSSIST